MIALDLTRVVFDIDFISAKIQGNDSGAPDGVVENEIRGKPTCVILCPLPSRLSNDRAIHLAASATTTATLERYVILLAVYEFSSSTVASKLLTGKLGM